MESAVTILDLASISGVSKSTISRYLRGENVSKEKGVLIEKAIIDSGYIRNNYAQLLRSSKSNFIGVLVPDLDNPFFLTIIKRLDQLAYEEGKTLIIKTTDSSFERELEALAFIRGFRVDGIFLCRSELNDEKIKELNITVPLISIDRRFNSIISVVSNNFTSGYTLTKHVFSQVTNNVMFFSRKKESTSVNERISGYIAYCKEVNKTPYNYKYDKSKEVDFDDLLKYINDNNIEAVVSRNDNEAIKIQSYLNDLFYNNKFRRIKVAGFDNIRLSKHILPKLTTIDQKIESTCDLAYGIFKDFKNKEIKTYVQDSQLIIRKSTT